MLARAAVKKMKYGLIGGRLGHSFSREIHRKIADYPYELCELTPKEVPEFLRRRDFEAINVTIPYKQTVIPYLDSIDEAARRIGAVNTIVRRNGKLYGYNTDYSGAAALLRHAGIHPEGRRVLILGSGGTSQTLHTVVSDLGASRVLIASRHPEPGISVSYEEALHLASDTEILLNATPVGMFPATDGCPIRILPGADGSLPFPSLCGVADVIYNPLRTPLIRHAQALGLPAEGGLYMLAAQGVYASAYFRGIPADADDIARVFRSVLAEKQNIVLIGMPSSGKSTVGALLAEITGRSLWDSDAEIVRRAGKSIPELFASEGEAGFRAREREVIADLAGRQGILLATGGGAVLDPVNADLLRANGRLYFLDRSPVLLTATADRPLSSDREALEKRYAERYDRYVAAADCVIPNNGTPKEAADRILAAEAQQ